MSQADSAELSPEELESRRKAEALDNWRPFDVHTWSEYPEVNGAVDRIYAELKSEAGLKGWAKLKKKHIKTIVLDLYVKWLDDPEMYSGYYRGKWYYTGLDKRYNKLHISFDGTVPVVDALIEKGYVEGNKGHYGRDEEHSSHMARMRATEALISLITEDHGITPEMVERAPDTECIILRDYDEEKRKQVDIPYGDTEETNRMRNELYDYNNLLRCTFIDIPEYPPDGIPSKSGRKKIRISQHDKFVRRIFSNGTFEDGGRFYGGWWQRIPSEWRAKIRIWNTPVSERDYSGLHIVLLYAKEGIDYWREVGVDPYQLDEFEQSERMRDILKVVLLVLINVGTRKSAVRAVRSSINKDYEGNSWVYDEGLDLEAVIDAFERKHVSIGNHFYSGIGVRLQRLDSLIAEKVIGHFTHKDVPVLCIHDSFVIATDKAAELEEVMKGGFIEALAEEGIEEFSGVNMKFSGMETGKWDLLLGHPDWRDQGIDVLIKASYDYPEWKSRMEDFRSWDCDKEYYSSNKELMEKEGVYQVEVDRES